MLFCAVGQGHFKIRRLQNTVVTEAISNFYTAYVNGYFKNLLWLPGGLFPPTLGVWMCSGHVPGDWMEESQSSGERCRVHFNYRHLKSGSF